MTDEEVLESLLLDWYGKHEEGSEVTLEFICRDRPDLLTRLSARVAAVLRVEGMHQQLDVPTAAHSKGVGFHPGQLFDVGSILEQRGGDELGWLGRFRVLRMLGSGGMGAVFEAADTRNGRDVALKVIRPDVSDRLQSRARFLREARAASAVLHDNLMPVYEADEIGRVPYIVMPLFAGETLANRVTRGSLPLRDLVRLGRDVSRGLVAAQGAGIIHRDLKPSNVWLESLPDSDDGIAWRARIMDFGLALDLRQVERLTDTGFPVGTPEYMSPEQADDAEVTARSDVFSLGVFLYEAATGTPPFGRHSTLVAMLNAITTCPADPEPLRAAGVPDAVAAFLLQMLAKSPENRPDATTVAAEFRAVERRGFA